MKQKNFYKTILTLAFLFLFISSLFNLSSYAQDTISAKYFPLAVGNIYVYHYYTYPIPHANYKYKAVITSDTLINGKKYFYMDDFPLYGDEWVRYDSTSSRTLVYDYNNGCSPYAHDKIVDSLASKVNDHCDGCFYSFIMYRICEDTSNVSLFSSYNTISKRFKHDGLMIGRATYAKNIGLIFENADEPPGHGSRNTLMGCVINGVVYGDTTLTFVKQISSTIPEKYILHQNYPNPFNPNTKIKFDIPSSSFVKMVVYNLLGKEVATLVDEKIDAGSYAVDWNGSSYPSGVYFYKLVADNYLEVKKMALIK